VWLDTRVINNSQVSCTDIRVPACPYESCEIFKGRPRRNALLKLVHRQYKSFPTDRFCQVEMKNPTRLSNKSSNAWSCAEDQILENKNLRNMILNICTERSVKYFRQIYLPVREHTWLIGSGGDLRYVYKIIHMCLALTISVTWRKRNHWSIRDLYW